MMDWKLNPKLYSVSYRSSREYENAWVLVGDVEPGFELTLWTETDEKDTIYNICIRVEKRGETPDHITTEDMYETIDKVTYEELEHLAKTLHDEVADEE
jgi:hypothetical protein